MKKKNTKKSTRYMNKNARISVDRQNGVNFTFTCRRDDSFGVEVATVSKNDSQSFTGLTISLNGQTFNFTGHEARTVYRALNKAISY